MPRLDRFVDPLHRGLDYVKHAAEDVYDYGAPQQRSTFASWFGGSSEPTKHKMKEYAGRGIGNIGQKVSEAFGGHDRGHYRGHRGHDEGMLKRGMDYGHHYFEEEPGFFRRTLDFVEHELLGSTLGPLLFVAYPLVLGLFISSWAHRQIRVNRAWYDKINLPANIPPAWLYDPVWTMVLTCMGYASWLVFEENGFGSWLTLGIYNSAVLALVSWPVLFFNYHDNVFAPILATVLTGLMMLTNTLFFTQSISAGLLFIPATLWVSYMTVVNWQVYQKNAGLLRGEHAAKEKGEWPWASTAATHEPKEAKKVR
jgi:tryptophan-rich sensory protein